MAKVAERIKTHLRDSKNNVPECENMAADAMFELEQENEHVFFEALVELESHNVWVRFMTKLNRQSAPVSHAIRQGVTWLFPYIVFAGRPDACGISTRTRVNDCKAVVQHSVPAFP